MRTRSEVGSQAIWESLREIRAVWDGVIPTVTAQHKGISAFRGKVRVYEKPEIGAVRKAWTSWFRPFAREPLQGAISVMIGFHYPIQKRGPDIAWKTTRPDVDNVAKLLLDALTDAGWWTDDGQIAELRLAKYRSRWPGITVEASELLPIKGINDCLQVTNSQK